MSDYKPTALRARCLRQDGRPDKRVGTGEFAHGKVDPVETGKSGGQTGGSSDGGSSDRGSSDGSSTGNSGGGSGKFAGGKVDPSKAGKKEGKPSN